jgi:hypothetical protein
VPRGELLNNHNSYLSVFFRAGLSSFIHAAERFLTPTQVRFEAWRRRKPFRFGHLRPRSRTWTMAHWAIKARREGYKGPEGSRG